MDRRGCGAWTSIPAHPPPSRSTSTNLPSYSSKRDCFWYDWGPVFYRGRLDGSARFLGIASDPGPTERIAARTLVGDAGQRVQGFLTKLGLNRSYVARQRLRVRAAADQGAGGATAAGRASAPGVAQQALRRVTGPALQAIVAFGAEARRALDLWDSKPDVPTFEVPHPSSHNTPHLLQEWRQVIPQLREIVDPDPGGDNTGPNYGTSHFEERDYARIPPRDLPFGMPDWFGDDAGAGPPNRGTTTRVERPGSDLRHKLIWQAPKNRP